MLVWFFSLQAKHMLQSHQPNHWRLCGGIGYHGSWLSAVRPDARENPQLTSMDTALGFEEQGEGEESR